MVQTLQNRRLLISALAALVAAAFAALYLFTPMWNDDYVFLALHKDMATTAGGYDWWRGATGVWRRNYLTDNVRVAQWLMPVAVTIPRWVSAVFSSLIFAAAMWVAVKIVPGADRRPGVFTVLAAAMVLLLPWNQMMFLTAMQLNYTWPMLPALLCLLAGCRQRSPRTAICAALGLTTALCHESFGLAVAAGSIAAMVLIPTKRSPRLAAIAAGALAGVAALMSVPGLRARISLVDGLSMSPAVAAFYAAPALLYIGAWLACLCLPKMRRAALSPTAVWCAAAVIPPIALMIKTTLPRAVFPASMFAAVGLSVLAAALPRPRRWLSLTCTAAVWAFLLAHLAVCDVAVVRLWRFDRRLMQAYSQSAPSGEFVASLPRVSDMPALALNRVPASMHTDGYTYDYLARIYGRRRFAPVPREAVTYDWNADSAAWHGAEFRYVAGGFIRPLESETHPMWDIFPARYADGSTGRIHLSQCPFTSRVDGKRYEYGIVLENITSAAKGRPVYFAW